MQNSELFRPAIAGDQVHRLSGAYATSTF